MLYPGKRRIAICFSGQPRTWRKCIDSWYKHLIEINSHSDIDVFCHIWDYNTKPNSILVGQEIVPEKVSLDEIQELTERLSPKKIMVESEKKLLPLSPHQPVTFSNFLSQYYSIMRCARLKKEYEVENMIQYDIVVRMRFDSFFMSEVSIKPVRLLGMQNTMHSFHNSWDALINRGRVGDIFWYSDSETYDIIADYYLNLQYMDSKFYKDCPLETIFYHYIKKNDIEMVTSNHWQIKLYRESQELSWSKNKDEFEIW